MSGINGIGGYSDSSAMQSLSQCAQSARSKFAEKAFSALDTNGDGEVDKAEFSSALTDFSQTTGINAPASDSLFEKLDTDGDGNLSQQELQQALQKMHSGHHHGFLKMAEANNSDGSSAGNPEANTKGLASAADALMAALIRTYQDNSQDPLMDTGNSISVSV